VKSGKFTQEVTMTSASLNAKPLLGLILSLFSPDMRAKTLVQTSGDTLDRKTLRAIRNLPPHMLQDIGILDAYAEDHSRAEMAERPNKTTV
jgi:hypothetical protein